MHYLTRDSTEKGGTLMIWNAARPRDEAGQYDYYPDSQGHFVDYYCQYVLGPKKVGRVPDEEDGKLPKVVPGGIMALVGGRGAFRVKDVGTRKKSRAVVGTDV